MNITQIRSHFPALKKEAIFLDNPAGTQIVDKALDRLNKYLLESNANHDGVFATSRASDAVIDETRQVCADFYNATRPEEIVFGPNMTSLTFNISRSLAKRVKPGDSIVVTRLDHDANITPWTMMAKDQDCQIHWVDFDIENGTLDLHSLEAGLSHKPKIVAVGYASNALGTINPIKEITRLAHDAGALVYVDAVQYAPHGPIDVQDLECDFLVSSAYKFYSTHVGVLYGRYQLLEELTAYKVRPASDLPPWKFETGTLNHEGIAGVLGALEYLEWLGMTFGEKHSTLLEQKYSGRKLRLKKAMTVIRDYEYSISRKLIQVLGEIDRVRIYGLGESDRVCDRVPTFAINVEGVSPRQIAEKLDHENIYVWNGNYYALAVTERLGVEESGGMVRIGPVHYNTLEEIEVLGEAIARIASGS